MLLALPSNSPGLRVRDITTVQHLLSVTRTLTAFMRHAWNSVHRQSGSLARSTSGARLGRKHDLSLLAAGKSEILIRGHQTNAQETFTARTAAVPCILSTYLNYWKPNAAPTDERLSDHELRNAFHREDGPSIDRRPVRIKNIRGHEHEYSLDKQGFQVSQIATPNLDFSNEAAVRQSYFPKIKELLKDATGATRIHIYDHHVRRQSLSASLQASPDGKTDIQGPVRIVHIDESAKGARVELAVHLPDEYETLRARPFAVVNAWKPLRPIVRDPLAVCDARTIAPEDLVPSVSEEVVGIGEIEDVNVRASERHAWFYVDRLLPEEVLLIKIFDSRAEDRFLGVAHSSFVDPRTELVEEPRESVEVRALCFW